MNNANCECVTICYCQKKNEASINKIACESHYTSGRNPVVEEETPLKLLAKNDEWKIIVSEGATCLNTAVFFARKYFEEEGKAWHFTRDFTFIRSAARAIYFPEEIEIDGLLFLESEISQHKNFKALYVELIAKGKLVGEAQTNKVEFYLWYTTDKDAKTLKKIFLSRVNSFPWIHPADFVESRKIETLEFSFQITDACKKRTFLEDKENERKKSPQTKKIVQNKPFLFSENKWIEAWSKISKEELPTSPGDKGEWSLILGAGATAINGIVAKAKTYAQAQGKNWSLSDSCCIKYSYLEEPNNNKNDLENDLQHNEYTDSYKILYLDHLNTIIHNPNFKALNVEMVIKTDPFVKKHLTEFYLWYTINETADEYKREKITEIVNFKWLSRYIAFEMFYGEL